MRNRIWRRPQAIKRISTLLTRLELTAQNKLLLLGVLLLVQPIRRSLPHFNRCSDERLLAHEIEYLPMHECHLTIGRLCLNNILPVLAPWRVSAEERAPDCGGSRCVVGFAGEGEM